MGYVFLGQTATKCDIMFSTQPPPIFTALAKIFYDKNFVARILHEYLTETVNYRMREFSGTVKNGLYHGVCERSDFWRGFQHCYVFCGVFHGKLVQLVNNSNLIMYYKAHHPHGLRIIWSTSNSGGINFRSIHWWDYNTKVCDLFVEGIEQFLQGKHLWIKRWRRILRDPKNF